MEKGTREDDESAENVGEPMICAICSVRDPLRYYFVKLVGLTKSIYLATLVGGMSCRMSANEQRKGLI